MNSSSPPPFNVVVLISGRGSNLQSIIDKTRDGELNINLCAVISNIPGAAGLERAGRAGIPTAVIDHRQYRHRESFDSALMTCIDRYQPQLVVLAGFMRVLGNPFVDHYAGRLINIHPSLLPKYPGLDTHARALAAGDSEHGASVHFVTHEIDGGPVIVQARVPVQDGDGPDALAERVLEQEHRITPLAIDWLSQGRLQLKNGQALFDGNKLPPQGVDANRQALTPPDKTNTPVQ